MAAAKNTVMLKPDSRKVLIAMAEAELEPKELAEAAGVSVNIVYIARRGFYVKPCYMGKISKALGVSVADLIEDRGDVSSGE
ncbi:MAG: helix-turn-helix transcriptional regulator [Lachnospiraceae bacterium]|nr:helix-turn-helix transcriptional regulator [Lachnospiraceae bacterium]